MRAKGRVYSWVLTPVTCFIVAVAALSQPPNPLLAPTPPMGWNSWDAYAQNITEAQVKENADFLAKNLKQFGWNYVVIDEGWYLPDPGPSTQENKGFVMDPEGRFLPSLVRFPSAADGVGFRPMGDYLHAEGLKFGIHILRGIPKEAVARNLPIAGTSFHATDAADQSDTCPWNTYAYGVKDNAAGQAYYDSLAKQYAGWGVDFIKVDCIADHPYKGDEIRMIRQALNKTGRPIVLSLSPGPTNVSHADEVRKYAEMWRISDDFWDHWGVWPKHEFSQGLLQQFKNAADWAPHTGDGHWADADMLPIGHLGPHPGEGDVRNSMFTEDEARTLLTFWCIFRSPLMIGANLTATDPATLGLLTNPEVIEVDQHSQGNRPIITNEKEVLWIAAGEDGRSHYIAVVNSSNVERTYDHSWAELGLQGSSYEVRDLWRRREEGKADHLHVVLSPHAAMLLKATKR
ncbi:Alpha-galactosidase precursor [Acidisarcina polymorpha]|uniref:Alpha-galactosidase n=1 Tax=Acidisarcina polymorpha TaxID=2211140 RepID=A0A2Z5FW23_9BACT|nr:glycoside hydrolase family 27 protein [Acidisarcina polymorpha]AXC11089.1 Alpha-galactosidase precursor [Acidisarcina polymorpha]